LQSNIEQIEEFLWYRCDKFHVIPFRPDSFVLRVFCPLPTALAACQQPSVVFTVRFSRPRSSIFIMKIFKDIFSGDEMFSDTYKFKLIDGVLYEVYGKLITRKVGDVTLDGANPSAEESCEGTEDAVESGVDIVLNHRLMETYAFPDKKSFTLYLKEYMKRLVDKMTENGSTEVDVFKTNINKVSWTGFLLRVRIALPFKVVYKYLGPMCDWLGCHFVQRQYRLIYVFRR